jgi:protocatechuate 3,4-dioxygenase beta subunit
VPPVRIVAPTEPGPISVAPNGAFEGRVVSAADGSPIPSAQLTFARAEEASSVAARTDGTFRFDARVAGRWSLAAVTAPGFLPFAPAWGASPVSLEARAGEVVRGVTVTLSPEVRYEGRVVDERGAPVAGAEVRILGEPGSEAVVPLRDQFTSSADGRFSFAAPEDAVLEARKPGFAPGRGRVDYTARVTGRLTLRLTQARTGLLAIEGVVEDARGTPLSGATVTAQAQASRDEAAARTGADGRFRLDALAPGGWWIRAERAGFAPAAIVVQAGATSVRLRLVAGGRIEGRVRDQRGRPVAPFTVIVQSVTVRAVSVVDPDGRYVLEDLAPGTAVLSVVAPGYAPSAEARVPVPAPGTAPAVMDFDLTAGGRLSGVVLTRGSRTPVAGANVEVEGMPMSAGVPVRIEAVSGLDGRFELTGVSEQPMSLFASAPGHHARVLSVPGVPSGDKGGPVEIELTPLAAGEEPRVELAGIGVQLAKDGEALQILKVFPGGGAAEVGLAAGDAVIAIDGASVARMTMSDVVPLLRGPEGTVVTLTVVKGGADGQGPIVIVVPRRLVRG